MQVRTRNGSLEPLCFDKILHRISVLAADLPGADAVEVAKATIAGLRNGILTSELDGLAASVCASLASRHPDFSMLGGRLEASNLQKECPATFADSMDRLRLSLVSSFSIFVDKNKSTLNAMVRHERDLNFDYFGIATLKQGYLLRDTSNDNKICETPQYLYLRVAVALHHGLEEEEEGVLQKIHSTYQMLSQGLYSHASPTMFNAGLRRNQQLASCFLLPIREDSLSGIFETVKDCAIISKHAGGLGVYIGNVRAAGSRIYGTGGKSDGTTPLCRILNETSRYANQSGRRKGAFAVYMPPWHRDVFHFLELRSNTGAAELRARDLFTALMVPDLFMQRVKEDADWTLFCPTEVAGLDNCWGKFWEARYTHAEKTQQGQRVKARLLWSAILKSQMETGTPYLIFRDAANAKSNQQHSGTIKNSNLCAEIMQTSSAEETAVCNLASLCLPHFVTDDKKIDIDLLHSVTRAAVHNLDRIIEITTYPVPEAKMSNMEHRPIGLGICGLQDLFMILGIPFDSQEAAALNERIAREIYFAAISASVELAKKKGHYPEFEGSPASQGKLQPDLWGVQLTSERWHGLKEDVKAHGLRNSLLIALMPTASTSQILGVCESFEPVYSNLMVRRTLAGEFAILNRYLVRDLERRGLWNEQVRAQLLRDEGSVQNIASIPDDLKRVYQTVWEVPMKAQIELSAGRGPYVCQSQSLNVYFENATERKLSSSHFYAWEAGLKTGCYYVRTKAATSAKQSCSGDVCVMCTV